MREHMSIAGFLVLNGLRFLIVVSPKQNELCATHTPSRIFHFSCFNKLECGI